MGCAARRVAPAVLRPASFSFPLQAVHGPRDLSPGPPARRRRRLLLPRRDDLPGGLLCLDCQSAASLPLRFNSTHFYRSCLWAGGRTRPRTRPSRLSCEWPRSRRRMHRRVSSSPVCLAPAYSVSAFLAFLQGDMRTIRRLLIKTQVGGAATGPRAREGSGSPQLRASPTLPCPFRSGGRRWQSSSTLS